MIQIRITLADGTTEVRDLDNGQYTIGRVAGDIVVGDPKVSGVHALLAVGDWGVKYDDQNSSNGSLNPQGQAITQPWSFEQGETLRLGGASLTLLRGVPQAGGTQMMEQVAVREVLSPQEVNPLAATNLDSSSTPANPSGDLTEQGPPQRNENSASSVQELSNSPLSHPEANVRHSYPLAIQDASISTALGLVVKTLPFALARLGVLVAMTVAGIIWWAITLGGAAFLAVRTSPIIGYAWMGANIVGMGFVWHTIARYFLYLLKAAHISVLTELITTGSIAHGNEGMFQYGIRTVKARFGEVNVLFAMDLLIEGVVKAFNRTLNFIADLLPIPGLDSLMGIVNAVLKASTTYIDETLFSYNLARGDENSFRSAKDGLIYYAQNSKEVLKTGMWAVVVDKVVTTFIWLVMLAPAFALSAILPASGMWVTITAFVCAIVFAGDVRAAFLKPLLLTMVMIKFHNEVQGQEINLVWDERLTNASSKFKELKEQAVDWVAPTNSSEKRKKAA